MQTRNIFIVSAPSGAGKTSLVNAACKKLDNVVTSISYTTRPKRNLETDGEDYFFIDSAQFNHMLAQDLFLEHANVFGYYYGSSKVWIENALAENNDVILELDWNGARQVRAQNPKAVSIFILPPSLEILQQRLLHRQQDSTQVIAKRMQQARDDISHYQEYDYVITNDSFAQASEDLIAIIHAHRLSFKLHAESLQNFINKLIN